MSIATEPATGIPPARIEFAYPDERLAAPDDGGSAHDLRMVRQLLDRCWREIDASDLNVKLTDIVRLLEIKGKLSPQAGAERTFWSLIDQMRREELSDFGDVSSDDPPPGTGEDS